jgi:hypothetical protein
MLTSLQQICIILEKQLNCSMLIRRMQFRTFEQISNSNFFHSVYVITLSLTCTRFLYLLFQLINIQAQFLFDNHINMHFLRQIMKHKLSQESLSSYQIYNKLYLQITMFLLIIYLRC